MALSTNDPSIVRVLHSESDIAELEASLGSAKFWSHDLAPIPLSARCWGMWDMVALWVALSACIPTYMLASSMINEGMNWWQAVLTIFLGNTVVLIPMILNAHAGTKYGIPFPVLCRASFGLRGANLPAILRAIVACGWFGIQTWIGGFAIYSVLAIYIPSWSQHPKLPLIDISLPQLACFLFFWCVSQYIVWRGIESVRILLKIKAPLLIGLGLALLVWAYHRAGGFGPMFANPSAFEAGGPQEGKFWSFFFPALTANVGFWATLALNIPDFTRYVKTQRDQVLGQVVGLPSTMGLYSFIGVAVTSATVVIYGQTIWDPVELLARFESPFWHALGLFGLVLATLATNLAANVVGPANDFANLNPRYLSFRTGAMMTGVIGILMQPWRLVADPSGYIYDWLVAYSALLGAIGGVMIADYFLVRRTQLDLRGLYAPDGPYWYVAGFNPSGICALIAGIAPCVPGFLATTGIDAFSDFWTSLYHYAWFISFGVSFLVYLAMTLPGRKPGSTSGLIPPTGNPV